MYLRNKYGRIVEVPDDQADSLIKQYGMEIVSDEEANEHYAQKQELAAAEANQTANTVYFQSVTGSPDGYGMSRNILKRELLRLGVPMSEAYEDQKVGLLYNYPYSVLQMRTDVRLVMTMFESDKIPEDWPDYLNAADEVIVPSKFCADTFARSGVKATVVPLGYNDRLFSYQERPVPLETPDPFVFIHYGSFNHRKGFSEVFEAFNAEFDHKEPVKLILKTAQTTTPLPIIPEVYPNIEVVTGNMSEKDLAELLGRANCMVYPSRGEGFGITPLEAMATGLPAIVPNAHGISEYFNSNYMLEVKVGGECPALYNKFKGEDVGKMVVCDVDDLRKQMRHAFNNQRDMKELGKAASEYVKKYTYQATAKALAEIIKKWQRAEIVKRGDSKYLQVERV